MITLKGRGFGEEKTGMPSASILYEEEAGQWDQRGRYQLSGDLVDHRRSALRCADQLDQPTASVTSSSGDSGLTTPANRQSPRAWNLDSQAGIASYDDKIATLLVRCVRGSIVSPVPDDSAFLTTDLLGRPTGTSITVNAVPAQNRDAGGPAQAMIIFYGTQGSPLPIAR